MVRLQLPCIPAKGEYVLEYFVSFYCKWTKINPSPPPRRKAMFIYERSKWSWSEGCTERGSACASNTNCQDNDLATWRQLHTRLLPLYRKLTLLLLLISDYSFLPLLPFSLSISRSFRPWLAGAEFPPYFFLSVVEIPLLLLSISPLFVAFSLSFLFFLASLLYIAFSNPWRILPVNIITLVLTNTHCIRSSYKLRKKPIKGGDI